MSHLDHHPAVVREPHAVNARDARDDELVLRQAGSELVHAERIDRVSDQRGIRRPEDLLIDSRLNGPRAKHRSQPRGRVMWISTIRFGVFPHDHSEYPM